MRFVALEKVVMFQHSPKLSDVVRAEYGCLISKVDFGIFLIALTPDDLIQFDKLQALHRRNPDPICFMVSIRQMVQ